MVISQRGLGKTFGQVKKALCDYIDHGRRFVYVVETLDDVKTLSANSGERFFSALEEYYHSNPSSRSKRYYTALFEGNTEIESGETDLVEKVTQNKVIGGTIKVNGETAGYLIAINSFGNLKRNNFVNIGIVIFDEFIPEKIDIRHMEIPYKVASVIQTIARRKDIKIYMLGNSVRLDDILLCKLKLANMKKGEIRVIKDKFGVLVVGHYVDPKDYPEFTQSSASSVAGRLATLLGEDNLEKNEFKGEIDDSLLIPNPPKRSHLLFCLHGAVDSVRVNATKDYATFYVMSDYGKNLTERICLEEKYVSGVVRYRPEWREVLLNRYANNQIKFESGVIHMLFKNLMKLDVNA